MAERDDSLCLYVAGQKGEEKVFPLDKDGMVVGRDQACEVILPDNSISKKHAQVLIEDGRTMITDGAGGVKSVNGVYVNDTRISMPTTLKEGDVVKLGVLKFDVKYTSSIRNAVTLDEVRDIPALKQFLERGDIRRTKEGDVIGRLKELVWDGSDMVAVFDEALDLAMDRNELQRVAFISRAKHEAVKLMEGRGKRTSSRHEGAGARKGPDPDATIVDLGVSSSKVRMRREEKKNAMAVAGLVVVAALVALALITLFIY
ncbi:MAG: FHA domain-containing protein [Nitrospinae bacterium]|nr:FHA domain-containing protein [Nitrospinota bacterium]MBF0634456.1 FHA domain-containing protein [Nitrospinota bacterium]